MKKIKWIFPIIFLCSCMVSEGDVVKNIQSHKSSTRVEYETSSGASFWARKGLYNIGDTVKFAR